MDLYYAKAYMAERLAEAQTRRLVGETRPLRRGNSMPNSRRLGLASLLRALSPAPSQLAERPSLDPGCCAA